MKALLSILFLLSATAAFAASGITLPVQKVISDDVLLSAIATVETGNNPARLGHSGERTQLQIMPGTWRKFSRIPHSQAAANPVETDRVARAYLAQIRARLQSRGLPETPFFIAAAWNAGPGWKTLTSGTISYAERVANIVGATPVNETTAVVAAVAKTLEPTPTVAPALVVATSPVVAEPIVANLVPAKPIPFISLGEPQAQPTGAMMIFANAGIHSAFRIASN
jgi:hypothetical protein